MAEGWGTNHMPPMAMAASMALKAAMVSKPDVGIPGRKTCCTPSAVRAPTAASKSAIRL